MPLSRSRDYLSIGEVLEAIRADFPDVSISKIRFLESEGLINPERTGSGYRKFYDPDVARLRYILSLQKDHFLPLKVIRERLAEADASGSIPEIALAGDGSATARAEANGSTKGSSKAPSRISTDVQLDRDGLAKAAGLSSDELQGLEDFGLIVAGDFYDGNDLAVAKAARRLLDYGLEPRHLRMYRQWAEREASFFEQIVAPMARRKDPSSQLKAAQSSQDLIGLSREIRDAMLRTSMKQLF